MTELIEEYSSWTSALPQGLPNPDTLVNEHADGLAIYHAMYSKDPYVRDSVEALIASVLSSDWQITPTDESEKSIEIAKWIEYCLYHQWLKTENGAESQLTNQAVFEEMLKCIVYGYSVTELVWQFDLERELYRPALKPRTPWNIAFDFDSYGNLKSDGVILSLGGRTERLIWPGRLIIMPYKPTPAAWAYGNSLLRPVYRAYYLLDMLWRLRGMHLQKMASGIKIGKYPSDATEGAIADFKTQCRKLTAEGFIILPDRFDLAIESAPTDTEAFGSCLQDLKTEISLAITGQTLASNEGKFGSRAQAAIHVETRETRVQYLRWLLSDAINTQIIPLIVEYNWGKMLELPAFSWVQAVSELNAQEREAVKMCLDNDIPILKTDVYRAFGLTQPGPNDETMFSLNRGALPILTEKSAMTAFSAGSGDDDVDELLALQDKYLEIMREALSPLYAMLKEKIKKYVADHWEKIVADPTIALDPAGQFQTRIAQNPPIRTKIVKTFERQLTDMTWEALDISARTIKSELAGRQMPFAADPMGGTDIPEALRAAFESIRSRLQAWAEYGATESMDELRADMAGLFADIPINAATLPEYMASIDEMYERWIARRSFPDAPSEAGSAVLDGDLLHRLLRNAVERFTNAARRELFRNSRGVVGVRFVGISDSRQSKPCAWLAGKYFKLDHPDLDWITPPNHPYCRSVMRPVMWYEVDINWHSGRVPESIKIACYGKPGKK